MYKNVLVTGGAGFIGSNLTEKLVSEGYQVRVIDNLSTGNKDNLKNVIEKIDFIEGDIMNKKVLNKALSDVEGIFHLAAIPSVQKSIENPEKSFMNSSVATLNLLNLAREMGVKRVVYSASSSAYGDQEGEMKTETMQTKPLSPYATGKLSGEYLMQAFANCYEIETVCLRYFNIFGPKQDPNSPYSAVIPRFITAILEDESPEIYGDGLQSRDFTYVDNAVRANILAMQSSKVGAGEVINTAGGKNYSLLDTIKIINEKLGKNIEPIFKNARTGDIKHSLANIARAKELIDYEPVVDFEKGIERTVGHYKNEP